MKNKDIQLNTWHSLPAPAGVHPTHFLVGKDKVPASADPQLLQDATHWCVGDAVPATGSLLDGIQPGMPASNPTMPAHLRPHGGENAAEQAFWSGARAK